MRRVSCIGLAALLSLSPLFAQDFGFGFGGDDSAGIANNALNVSVGGEVSAAVLGFVDDFHEGTDHTSLGDIFSGKLNFSAGTSFADGVINLKLRSTEHPVSIDEAYIRAYFGGLEIEGGLRKLVWGKADSLGPLDVINPLDYTELTDLSNFMNLKIARPLVHASYRVGSFSKIEAVFVPTFEPLRYATEGRWVPAQMAKLNTFEKFDEFESFELTINWPDKSTVEYAQAGARFTTTIGPADFGLQYYYGRLNKPNVAITFAPSSLIPIPLPSSVDFVYNPYHQVGIDWAQVLFGFNIRTEFAANITYDFGGDDGSVYNPALLWSFGFDRDLVWGINLNFQCNESIRLMDDKITGNPIPDIPKIDESTDPAQILAIVSKLDKLDMEAKTDITSTQIIAAISKKFFRDKLETRIAALWGIEDSDFFLMPSLIWTNDTVSVELSAGIFGGDKEGQFGQYKDNCFVKAALTYSF